MTEEETRAVEKLEDYEDSILFSINMKEDFRTILRLIQNQEYTIREQNKAIKKMAKQLNKLICNIDFDKKLQEGEDYSECIEEYIREQVKEG